MSSRRPGRRRLARRFRRRATRSPSTWPADRSRSTSSTAPSSPPPTAARHGDARLCDGFLEGHEIECPHHQGRFDVRTGAATGAPADVALASYPPRSRPAASAESSERRVATSPPSVSCYRPQCRRRKRRCHPSSPACSTPTSTSSRCGRRCCIATRRRTPSTRSCAATRRLIRSPSSCRRVNRELDALCALPFRPDELAYLRSLRFIRSDFVDFLRIFHFQRDFIDARAAADGEGLEIVASGPQVHVMAFEIFVLAIVNELYFRRFDAEAALAEGRAPPGRQDRAAARVRDASRSGRRRSSSSTSACAGASRASGTAKCWSRSSARCRSSSRAPPTCCSRATSAWCRSARWRTSTCRPSRRSAFACATSSAPRSRPGCRSTAATSARRSPTSSAWTPSSPTSTCTSPSCSTACATIPAIPYVWGEKALAHYEKLRIDARTKRLVFSDGLDFDKSFALYRHFADRAPCGFGIGTNLTNDMGLKTLHIVMKLTHANRQPVAKLSDSPGKLLCDDETFLAYLRQVFNVPA